MTFFYQISQSCLAGYRLALLALLLAPLLAIGQSLPGSGNSLTFNGSSTYINCGTADRDITTRLTVEAWIKTTSLSGQFAVTKYSNSLFSESGFEFGTSQGRALINGRAGQNAYFTSGSSTTNVSDGRWHHIAGQVDGSNWRIYVDGVLENSINYNYAGGDLRTPEPMTIGTYTYLTNFYFNGDIDEVRVWRTARTAAEIQDNMCRKFAVAPADLVAYYRLDQASGSVAPDHGSVPTSGTLTGFSAPAPWHLSGAPLGDASASLYQNALPIGSRASLATAAGDSAIAITLSAQARGLQLYAVNSAPSIAPPGTAASSYVGVFTIGATTANTAYSLRLRPTTGPACRNAVARTSNDLAWTLPAQLPATATSLLVPTTVYRSEHILTDGLVAMASITGDSLLCAGARTQLSIVSVGANVLWSTGATTATITNLLPGTYTVTVNYSTGCSRILRRTVRAAAIPSLTISGDSLLCAGAGTTLTAAAVGATAYRWSNGATTPTISVTQPGIYGVVATYGPGCTTSARRTVRLSPATAPAFTLGTDTTLCEGDQLLLRGPAGAALRYQWSDGSTGQQLLVQASGHYTLRVLAACGEQSASRTVALRSCLKVPNIITVNADARNDLFAVEGLRGEGWALDIYNRWGRSVFQAANYHNDWGFTAAPGIYYVLLRRSATGYQYKGWLEVLR